MSSDSGGSDPVSYRTGFTKGSVEHFKDSGNRSASKKLNFKPVKTNLGVTDPYSEASLNSKVAGGGPIETQLIDPANQSNLSSEQVQNLVDIFKKRSEDISGRRLAPGVTQTRLIGR